MIISNVTRDQLDQALETVNRDYDGNVIWNREPEALNHKKDRFRLTLRVKSSRGPGAARSWSGRRLVSACWHVHGFFFDALPPEAIIRTAQTKRPRKPGDPWKDFNIGSQYRPVYASEACDC